MDIKSKISLFTIIIFVLQTSYNAQFSSEKERMDHANKLFEDQFFIEAEPHMLHFLSTKSNSEFNFKYGVCALFKYADKSKSLRYLEKAVKDSKVDPRAFFYLGKANHLNYLFADALTAYNKFKSLVAEKESKKLEVDMHIHMCESGQGLMKNLSDLIVQEKTSTGKDKFQYSYDLNEIGGKILITDQFQSKMDEKLDYKSIIYFPPIGQDVLFFSSYGKDGETGLDIYSVNRESTGEWSEPVKLPESINTPYDDSYPYLKPDGKTLYFSSKGHNSMGGYDIFRCSFDKIAGNYGPVDNLDYKINTPSDDILYIVDDNNENAYFSSDRSSDGGLIDVYKVKVKVFPIQNTLIAGVFFNTSNPDDLKATIKVQDVKTDKLIGVYTVDNKQNYSILLPSAGRYKFIVETPQSEKIHAGLVEVKPQTELKALKQEIELASNNGVETLVIRNLFDQNHENESKILAAAVKQMANPEVNIDQIPDSILNDIEEIAIEDNDFGNDETSNVNSSEITERTSSIDELLETNKLNIKSGELRTDKLINQEKKINNFAYQKAIEAENKAIEADRLLAETSQMEDSNLKKEKLQSAAKLNQESKQANQKSQELIELSKNINEDIKIQKDNLASLKAINEKLISEKESENNIIIEDIENEINEIVFQESSIDKLISESKEKEKIANLYLNEAQALRADKESMQYQLDKQKNDLSKAKKKKDINSINENISTLEQKISESETLIKEQFELYEKTEKERKVYTDKIELAEEIIMSDIVNETSSSEPIDLFEIEEKTQNIDAKYIEKNSEDFASIEIEIVDDLNENEILESRSTNNELNQPISSISDTLISENEKENYSTVSQALENTTPQLNVFENITETIISYNNDDSQFKAEELEKNKEEIISIQNEINGLETQLSASTKPKEIQEIQETLELKRNLLSNAEDQLIKSFEEVNSQEIDHNEELFINSSNRIRSEAKSDEDFLSATFYMESASKAIENAKKLREQADIPTTTPQERKELLKEAYQNEMIAIDVQQTANNLMADIVAKYPIEEDENPTKVEIETEEFNFDEEKKKEEEFIENFPVNIPVAKNNQVVEPVNINGEIFTPSEQPKNYKVESIADDNPIVNADETVLASNKLIIEKNKKNISSVNDLINKKEILELQKNDLLDDKLKAKVDKKILKIEKKKAKSQLKMSADIQKVNQSEITILSEQVNAQKNNVQYIEGNYKVKQAENYSQSANDLSDQARKLRKEAENVKDPVLKAELIEKAVSSENTSIVYLKKSKKLYEEAIVEDFSDDRLTVAKNIENNELKQSEKLQDLSESSEQQSIIFQEKSKDIRATLNMLPKKERAEALVIAQQYDSLAFEEKQKAQVFKEKSKVYKEVEMALVEDIKLAQVVENQDMSIIAGTQQFKDYNEKQNQLNDLVVEREEIKNEKRSYEMLSSQMSARAAALDQEAKAEENPIKKADLLSASNELKKRAKKNKEIASALVISIDSLKDEIKSKELDQKLILEGLDTTTAKKVRGLAISGKADEVLDKIAQELPTNTFEESKESNDEEEVDDQEQIVQEEEQIESNIEEIDLIVEEVISVSSTVVTSKDFIPPTKILKDIFVVTQNAVYSEENPIPINPTPPNGLVFKVQVGAFRNPIPQDLFKGFAPISAEKVRDDITRYRVGYFTSFDIANQSKKQVRELGYKDAFVVALMNGEKIKISEAIAMQDNRSSIEEINSYNNDFENNNGVDQSVVDNNNLSLENDIDRNENENNSSENITFDSLEINSSENINLPTIAQNVSEIDGLFYSVQVGAFSKPLSRENDLNVSPLMYSKVNNLFKYSTGKYNDIEKAGVKKAELLQKGILDAFIIAYNNGRIISLNQANSTNPNRSVEYSNPEIFYLDFGTYKEDVPKEISDVIMNLRPLNIRSRPMLMGKQFYSKKYNSIEDAQAAINQAESKGLKIAKIVKTYKDDFDLNYEFRIDLGTYYEELPKKLLSAFDNLKDLELQTIDQNGGNRYVTISRDNYEDASTDLNACRLQGIKIAKIIVFKGGIETTLDNVLKSFK